MRVIYCITNKINNKRYVGQTKNLARRKKQHLTEAPRCCDHPMARAVRKYGRENFTIEAIEECDDVIVDEREKHWIAEYRTSESEHGYNCDEGGNACKSLSEETKRKISESHRRYEASLTPEQKEQRSERLKKRPPNSKSQRIATSRRHKGVPKSKEHKLKIAATHKTRIGKHAENCKCALCHPYQGKLTVEQRQLMKLRCDGSKLSKELLANEFNVSITTVHRIFLSP